ncbi:short chain dehydrogenase reductase [Stagonosporopsis vannaccii]|nr:short chain dehydrogenase reductase [Stagonosporopsis vannaccii]
MYPAISPEQTPALQQPGKVVLITGAGRGIGRAIALQYAHAGVGAIILCARSTAQLDQVAHSIHAINASIRVHQQPVDVTSDSAVAALASQVATLESRLDILVNNAGYSAPWGALHESSTRDWWHGFQVNLKGPFLLTHAFLPLLTRTAQQQQTGHVHVVNVASMGAHQVNAFASNYTISKLAVCRLTENIDVGYRDQGVIAVSVHPGGVMTALAEQELDILRPYLNDTPELCGGFAVWITAEPRKWLGGRYVAAPWDVDALLERRDEIVEGDKLKVKLVV